MIILLAVILSAVILVLGLLRANGVNPLSWFRKKIPIPGIPRVAGSVFKHVAVLAVVGVLFAMFIIYAVDPVLWNRWTGGERGWYYIAAAIAGILLAVVLKEKGAHDLVWLGVIALALSPLIKETMVGQKILGVYEKAVSHDQDIDQDTFKQRILERGGVVKSISLDARTWQVGLLGQKACYGEKYTRGLLDGAPNYTVRCFNGAEPHPAYWPTDWNKSTMPKTGADVQHPIALKDAIRVEMVNLSHDPIKVFAKVP